MCPPGCRAPRALTAQLSKLSDKLASLEQRTNQLLQEAAACPPPAAVPRRKQQRRFTADEMAQVAERYLIGLSVNQVAHVAEAAALYRAGCCGPPGARTRNLRIKSPQL